MARRNRPLTDPRLPRAVRTVVGAIEDRKGHRVQVLDLRGLTNATDYFVIASGTSDTHVRGTSKVDRVLSAVPLLANRDDAGAWMDRLISAALKDEDGAALDGAVQTLKSL